MNQADLVLDMSLYPFHHLFHILLDPRWPGIENLVVRTCIRANDKVLSRNRFGNLMAEPRTVSMQWQMKGEKKSYVDLTCARIFTKLSVDRQCVQMNDR